MANSNHQQLLEQLESEVNRVLEYTGRLFAAANSNPKSVPVAQISKLKQVVQSSNLRFHEALDHLEDELQTAKLVMRRDLALCREASGLSKPSEANLSKSIEPLPNSETVSDQKVEGVEPPQHVPADDTVMQDAVVDNAPAGDGDGSQGSAAAQKADVPEDAVTGTQDPTAVLDTSTAPMHSNDKQSEGELKIDTQTQATEGGAGSEQPVDEDKPPDTGTFSNMNDLDSLFGGPLSAGPGDAPGFNLDPNTNDDFDFDAFASSLDNNVADNDNISALLPGLEDYANAQSSGAGEPDFDAIFSTALPGDGEQSNIPHRDSTFDDLGDLLDFGVGEFGDGTGDGGENENNDFDFSLQ